jgi:hypothetical protein
MFVGISIPVPKPVPEVFGTGISTNTKISKSTGNCKPINLPSLVLLPKLVEVVASSMSTGNRYSYRLPAQTAQIRQGSDMLFCNSLSGLNVIFSRYSAEEKKFQIM